MGGFRSHWRQLLAVIVPVFTSGGRGIAAPVIYAAPDVWSWSFNDGTLGWPANGLTQFDFWNFYDAGDQPVIIVPDATFPTAIGTTGYSGRCEYVILASETPDNVDRNRNFELQPWHIPGADTLTHFFVRQWVKLGTPANYTDVVARKLIYIMSDRDSNLTWNSVIGGWSDASGIADLHFSITDTAAGIATYTLHFTVPYTLPYMTWIGMEIEYLCNTPGVSDGAIRIWIYDATGTVLRDQTWTGLNIRGNATPLNYLQRLLFGNQADRDTIGKEVNEYRYVNRLALSTQRIGP